MTVDRKTTVAIVDDDPQIRVMLERFLVDHGLSAFATPNGAQLSSYLQTNTCDIIVLDVMLPGEDGISICRRIRSNSQIPIILLTAMTADTDRIVGLEVGADDYITKPFNPRELLARIRAVLRRVASMGHTKTHNKHALFQFEGWKIDLVRRTLRDEGDTLIELTSNEFDLLAVFVQRPQSVLSRDQLLDLVHGKHSSQLDRSIDVQISRLRRKLETHPEAPELIRTLRSEGYMFASPVKRSED